MIKPRVMRLYRVVVDTCPDEPVPALFKDGKYGEWKPPEWDYDYIGHDSEPTRFFIVGQSRTYHSRAVAQRKAEMWEAHGCTTHIDVSKPVEWESQ